MLQETGVGDGVSWSVASYFYLRFFLMPETLFDRPTEDATEVERITKRTEKGGDDEGAPVAGVLLYVPPSLDSKTYFRRIYWSLRKGMYY